MANDPEEDDHEEDYDSGPYCRHWYSPVDCPVLCARCGHPCWIHRYGEACEGETCQCPTFEDED